MKYKTMAELMTSDIEFVQKSKPKLIDGYWKGEFVDLLGEKIYYRVEDKFHAELKVWSEDLKPVVDGQELDPFDLWILWESFTAQGIVFTAQQSAEINARDVEEE